MRGAEAHKRNKLENEDTLAGPPMSNKAERTSALPFCRYPKSNK